MAGASAVLLLALAAALAARCASGASTCSHALLLSSSGAVPVGGDCERFADCCGSGSAGAKCFRKSAFYAGCKDACTPGEIDPFDNKPWDCTRLTCLDGKSQAAPADASGIVAAHGKLRLSGLQLSGAGGEPVQLVGVDTADIQFRGACVSAASLQALAKDWGVSVVRVKFQAGTKYGNTGDLASASQMSQLFAAVDAVQAAGMYAIVAMVPAFAGDPNAFLSGTGASSGPAITFWRAVAQRYVGKAFVMYDIAGEPGNLAWSTVLKPYHDAVIGAIRAVDPDTIILAATGGLNQRLQDPAALPVAQPRHVMYSVMLASKADSFGTVKSRVAAGAGAVPVFAVGWKGSDHSNRTGPDLPNSSLILDMLAGTADLPAQVSSISWTAFEFSDDDDIVSLLTPGACSGAATVSSLTCWGSYVQNTARRTNPPTKQPTKQPTQPTFAPTTKPTTAKPTTSRPTTSQPSTTRPTTAQPTTGSPTIGGPTAAPTGPPSASAPVPGAASDRQTPAPTRSPSRSPGAEGGGGGGVTQAPATSTGLILGALFGTVLILSLTAFCVVRYKPSLVGDDELPPRTAKVAGASDWLGRPGVGPPSASAEPYYPSPANNLRGKVPPPPGLGVFTFARRLGPRGFDPAPAAAAAQDDDDPNSRDSAMTTGPTFNVENGSSHVSERSVFSRESSTAPFSAALGFGPSAPGSPRLGSPSPSPSPSFGSPSFGSPALGLRRFGPVGDNVPVARVTHAGSSIASGRGRRPSV